ncbi:LEAF RUST 10 DISEASE-RESISTANCE LOCUS RECEPTOR-LIKE PROTEIN KINASE-like 1.1 [Morus notabilis]|uniref:LEAF RUST 10 DISEASE-RESISTANCE LOCUS RECEPTOR-LIKE PROTEIN KINASE-like 1.1 n=1 Tax=Morus notabilis TaxID=981085 RepID=UPI000CED3117|nr:LEAF RUST 10 DISEASE-RESISTANCE LOCUS RECEPTOR-LIKE PROTEIN KINASE-like 1.1 [Morus notabilis]XP_024023257.1 LEAF RUST 10 DISEASE-RESISTANCE LOCUS RECEPTOR-LIKE PROTEIN KINASE-like 1.1 [Morus notabilis]
MNPFPFFALSFISHLVLLSSAEEKKQNQTSCPTLFCGKFEFPYKDQKHPDCGLYTVNCSKPVPKIQFKEGGHWFPVENISVSKTILINDTSSPSRLDPRSCESIENFTLPVTSFSYANFTDSWTLFNCSHSLGISTVPTEFSRTTCGDNDIYYTRLLNTSFPPAKQCSTIRLPPLSNRTQDNEFLFATSFTVEVFVSRECSDCHNSGGQCETNSTNKFCCSIKGHKDLAWKLGIGIGLSLVVVCVVVFLLCRYKQKRSPLGFLSRNISDQYHISYQEGGSVYFGVHVFAYRDLEEATNFFDSKNELGDGGFGTVYHGTLKDGREVAVKRLYEHNYKRVEQYINEIEILTRLRHKNLVSLYGCTSRRSKELLLVYEYIANGTVADHLHGDRAQTSPLTWPIRMSIAIETATALVYLHASDIVHRDVKTNNILLDNNFCVKVADFGLSRLFPNDVTHVSTAPQGTPGYVDPEYHQCYQLTSKSDVYSFGVVLVELISSMPAVDMTRHRQEINLSNLAIIKIQKGAYNELVDLRLGVDSNNEVKRMTIAVAELAFQCLQQDKEMRPSMDEVLKELKRIENGNNATENQVKGLDGVIMSTVQLPSSPDCDEIQLLKSMEELPPSPNTVTEIWHSSRSSTPNISC